MQIVLAFFGSVFPVVLFNIDRRKIVWAGLCGAIGWFVYLLIYNKRAMLPCLHLEAPLRWVYTVNSWPRN
jgi:hypothetical protein